MGIVHTSDLKPGMVLAEAVRDVNGRLLLTEGKTIRAEHLRILKIWGINEVAVQGSGDTPRRPSPDVDPACAEAAAAHCRRMFRLADLEHPATAELFRLAVEHHSRAAGPPAPPAVFAGAPSAGDETPADVLKAMEGMKIVLPEIPSVVFELNEVIANPLSTAEHIARVVNRSPSLTAVLLKIVNSSFYGLPSKIDRISLAVTLIGTREISSLALGISILSMFKQIPQSVTNMHAFLRHSLACGVAARILAARMNFRQTEQMFVSGLLHDLGRLLLYTYFPGASLAVLSAGADSGRPLYEIETEKLGCDHGEIGRFLIRRWKLPLLLENNIAYHHRPVEATEPKPAALVHVADILVHALGYGGSGEVLLPPLAVKAYDELGLTPGCFEPVARQLEHQVAALESILE